MDYLRWMNDVDNAMFDLTGASWMDEAPFFDYPSAYRAGLDARTTVQEATGLKFQNDPPSRAGFGSHLRPVVVAHLCMN